MFHRLHLSMHVEFVKFSAMSLWTANSLKTRRSYWATIYYTGRCNGVMETCNIACIMCMTSYAARHSIYSKYCTILGEHWLALLAFLAARHFRLAGIITCLYRYVTRKDTVFSYTLYIVQYTCSPAYAARDPNAHHQLLSIRDHICSPK